MKPEFVSAMRESPLPEFSAAQEHEPNWVQQWRDYYQIDCSRLARQRLGSVQLEKYSVAVQSLVPNNPRGCVIVVHGYYDHMGLYGHLFRWALRKGLAVLACDLPGHGLSSGPRAQIDDFAEYQQVLNQLFQIAEQQALPQPWHLIGQSMGGAIVMDYALHQPPRPEIGELVLFAPLVRPHRWLQGRALYLALRAFVSKVPRRAINNSTDQAFLEFLRQEPLQVDFLPTAWVGALSRWIPKLERAQPKAIAPIIIQGDQDATVDWQHNLSVLESKSEEVRLCMLAGAGHHLVNEREHYRQRAFEFIDKFV